MELIRFLQLGKKWFSSLMRRSFHGWNCLNFLHAFVGYQANFPRFYKILKETSMHQIFTDSICFDQAAYKMHPKFGGNSVLQSFAGFIETPL